MTVANPTRWVVFVCAQQRFGFPLEQVSEIVTPRPFTRLPGAVPAVCGLVGLRGRVVTVLDAGIMLGLEAAANAPDHRLLLVAVGTRRVAIAVEEVVSVAPAQLQPPAAAPPGRLAAAVLGTALVDDSPFVALEPAVLVSRVLN